MHGEKVSEHTFLALVNVYSHFNKDSIFVLTQKRLKEQQSKVEMMSHNADIQGATERLKQLQAQLRVQIEAHIRGNLENLESKQARFFSHVSNSVMHRC